MTTKTVHPKYKAKITKRQAEGIRESLVKSARGIATRFVNCANGKDDSVTAIQYKCGAKILDKTVPDLKSVENTHKTEPRGPEEIKAELRALVDNNPTLIAQLLADTTDPKSPEETKH